MAKPPHNLINGNFLQELISAFETAETQGARSILLRSEMKHFSAGADVDGFGSEAVSYTHLTLPTNREV